ncbi:MAG: efflux RND transporter periplasmic adaptor subunit [Clostridiales bacterium]|nr:efflux RND transporter periplasmic adaptor subunit [Roseburia sp.]MDD7635975.1 efflux RND transporter periplasmic adaptor subunit [Clostridiales bacterium]MDY4111835.1 efflux RND transporter periplasmic adaptor subunit [Roseburia sp.]
MKDKKEMNEQKGTVAAVQPKKKKKKVLIIVLVIVALLAVLIGTAVHNMTKAVEMVMNTVEVEPVQLRDLSDTISLKGTIAGASSTNVTSKAVAEITAMNVQVGDIVQEGDVLCTLDSASIEEKIADLEKSVSNAQAVSSINSQQTQTAVQQALEDQETQLASAQRQVDDAQTNYNVAETQYNNGEIDFPTLLASKRALESAKASYDATLESTNRAIENAQLQVELDKYKDSDASSKDTLDSLREQLADCEVVAPCSGVVTSVNVRVGDINGEKVTILTIEDTSSLKLVATVDEADILKLQEGMAATVTADATGEEKINGTVSRVVRVKSQSTGGTDATAGGYSVEITIDNKDLLIGMAAKAKVMLKEKGEVLAIPYDLIQYDEDGNAFVLVAEAGEDGSATAVRKNIEVGEEVDYYTEIIGGDLKEGDMLIYDYTFSVVEGQEFAPEQMYSNQDMGLGDAAGKDATSVEVTE